MQLELSDPDLAYKCCLYGLKLSGFIFFSYSTINGRIHFVQKFTDLALFLISFAFSLYLAVTGGQRDIFLSVKSQILNLGTGFAWKLSLISVVLTKLVNIAAARQGFLIIKHSRSIDHEVK